MKLEVFERSACGIKIYGEVDICAAEIFKRAIEDLMAHGGRTIVLDMTEMCYIDSTGIGALIELKKKSLEKEQEMILCGVPENVRRLLDLTGVSCMFKMTEREEVS